jgi:hypothetical protein
MSGAYTNYSLVANVPEGNGKLKMNDGSVVIAEFRRSSNTGLRREWSKDGKLWSIGFRYRQAPVGHCW